MGHRDLDLIKLKKSIAQNCPNNLLICRILFKSNIKIKLVISLLHSFLWKVTEKDFIFT